MPMVDFQQSGSMPGGVLFSIYLEASDEDREADTRAPSSQGDSSPTVSANVLRTALPAAAPSTPTDSATSGTAATDVESFARLRETLLDDTLSPTEKIQQLLELGVQQLDVEGGYLNRIDSADGVHETTEVAGALPEEASTTRDLSVTYCRRVVSEGRALAVEHAEEQGWLDDPAYQKFGFSTYLGARVRSDGRVAGTVCFTSDQPREAPFDDADATLLALIARAIGPLLEQRAHDEQS